MNYKKANLGKQIVLNLESDKKTRRSNNDL